MTTVDDLRQRVKAIDVNQIAQDSIEDTRGEIIARQKEQLFQGVDKNDNAITPPYAPSTIIRKKKKGQPTDRVTLKDKGDFYNEIFVDVRSDEFIVDSANEKADRLIKKYGSSIFDLNPKQNDKYTEVLEPVFTDKIKKDLQL